MNWDSLQTEILGELGCTAWRQVWPAASLPPDPFVVAQLAAAIGVTAEALLASGIVLPDAERLRDAAVKRALWPQLRRLRARQ